jgi:hypothetical protein
MCMPGELHATGLYEALPSFFSASDTTRTRLIMRHAELARGGWHASLLSGELDVKVGRRSELRFGFEFPALRRNQDITYGIGDIRLRATARVFGDTLNASGLFLRSDVRIPIGGKGLRPFCNASLDGGAGLEARLAKGDLALKGAVLYVLAGERLAETDFANDNAITAAASLTVPIPAVAAATVALCLMRFDGGASRQIALVSLSRCLSPPLTLGIEGAVETGTEAERIFDTSVSVSFTYRFPPRTRPVSSASADE